MLRINAKLAIRDDEIQMTAVRARGPGGQNVNKVASAVQLRFDIRASSLPAEVKQRLLAIADRRVSQDGVLTIKAGQFRDQTKNRAAARQRLADFVNLATATRKPRIATRPTRSAREKRLDSKSRHGRTKALRGRVAE